jgi:uncharacterized protein (TIGR02145 family)
MNTYIKYIVLLLMLVLFVGCKKDKPTVTTSSVKTLPDKPTVAECGGVVKDNGGSPITDIGVCWNKSGDPQISDKCSVVDEDEKGIGEFNLYIDNLETNTTYFLKAFAINKEGTAYGNEVTFNTLSFAISKPCEETPTVTDYDGNVYKTVRIGDQCWMAENLRSRHYADGESIGGYSVNHYNDTVYGRLYNFPDVMYNDTMKALETGVQGICPDGWHIPSFYEWDKLFFYLGNNNAGAHLKQSGTEHWAEPNIADNLSGFNALPAGYRDNSNYDYPAIGEEANFWTCNGEPTEYHNASIIILENERSGVIQTVNNPNKYALSVRCIKDK